MNLSYAELNSLSETYGESFYIYDIERFRRNFTRFRAAFIHAYPKTTIAYSYKTNYLPAVCLEAHKMGALAEVVSSMELELALRLGIPGERILFNGPAKSEDDILMAVKSGVTVHVDSLTEARILVDIVSKQLPDKDVSCAIRCAYDFEGDRITRFGMDPAMPGFDVAVALLRSSSNIHLDGLHCHFSTERSVVSYKKRTEWLVNVAGKVFGDEIPQYLDIGGGFMSEMSHEEASLRGLEAVSYSEYAQAVSEVMLRLYPREKPELILEPGVGITADTAVFVCRVVDTKQIKNKNIAVTVGSIHTVKPSGTSSPLRYKIIRSNGNVTDSEEKMWDVSGYTCMENDYLLRNVSITVQKGDFIVIESTGAYTHGMKPPFIRPAPAILCRNSNGEYYCGRRPQTFDDVFGSYFFEELSV